MKAIPYSSAVGSLMYAMLSTKPDICFAVGMVSRFQSNPGQEHWTAVKHTIKYLKRTKDYILIFHSGNLVPIGYTDSNFQLDKDSRKLTSGYVFTLGAASEAAKEAVWLGNFLKELGVVPLVQTPLPLYCNNSGAVANSKNH
ncbi:secreted RxLR effector protein 161-like [Capsicum annuum]|uniref:secreted RxLR effector protein 161-like n=1 Tax=Capsicum annuum TaxID=4072 RepID=UPI001FB0FF95|nr:secreted RxLR effector protein 161-like [Capsicum annuum]